MEDWLFSTDNSLHVMRDNPEHTVAILAGLFGLRLTKADARKKAFAGATEMLSIPMANLPGVDVDQFMLAVRI